MSDYSSGTSSLGSTSSNATLTAFFDSRDDAEDAVNRLTRAGISQASVRLVQGNEGGTVSHEHAHKGFWESLADFFMPDEDRYTYAEGLSRGGYLVTVTGISGDQYDTALDILDDEGAVNIDEREQSWRSEGWSGYTGSGTSTSGYGSSSTSGYDSTSGIGSGETAGFGSSGTSGGASGSAAYGTSSTSSSYGTTGSSFGSDTTRTSDLSDEEVIPVVEEQLYVGKRDVSNGRVRVRSYVRETPVSEQVSLRDERVEIERRPVDRALSGSEAVFQDRVLEAEEHIEQAVVSKEARVTEEIALRKESDVRQETITDTVRSTEVEVEDERNLATDRSGTLNRR